MTTPREEQATTVVELPTPQDVEPAWYGVYISAPRTRLSSARLHQLLLLVVILTTVGFLMLGGSGVVASAAVAGVIGVAFGVLAYLGTSSPEIGISIGPQTVSFGRRNDQMHHWRRSDIASVTVHKTWNGEDVVPAIGTYLVPGYRYLTLQRRDGVVAHVSLDSKNLYANIIAAALVDGTPLPELSHPPVKESQKSTKRTWRDDQGPTASQSAPTRPAARRATSTAGSPPPAPAAAPSSAEPEHLLWRRATERHDAVLLAYSPYEVDPSLLMEYPAMTDVTVPATATFIEALSDASALRSEQAPPASLSRAYRDAVSALEVAWSSAERHARNVGLSLLQPEDQKRLRQARKLLAHAESSTTDAERATYFQQVKTLMDDLARSGAIVEPPKIRAAISAKVVQAITASDG